jgi:hypothetical protein
MEAKRVARPEKGHLLEIHLLEKTARHQNLNCLTLFEQMTKIYESARKSKKYAVHVLSSRCKFQTKMFNCSNSICSTETLKNVNCSN